MASIIRIKRSGVTGAPPSNALAQGELAYSYLAWNPITGQGGDRLYIGIGPEDTPGVANDRAVIGGSYFTSKLAHAPGTLTANSAIIVDDDNKIDILNVDNITINGDTISSNTNLILSPSGYIDVSSSRIINVGVPSANTDAVNKLYVDTEIAALGATSNLDIAGDQGSDSIALANTVFTIAGGTGISTLVANDTVTITLKDTLVVANTYGSSTAIPVLSINAQGQITSATTENIATTLSVATDNAGTGSINLLDETLTVAGGTGLTSSISGDAITITLDDTLVVANTYGSESAVATFTVDAQGRLTSASSTTIDILSTQVSDFTEAVQDVVGAFTSANTAQGMIVSYTNVAGTGDTLVISAASANTTQKGVASFADANFTVTDGAVAAKDFTIGSTTISLGDTGASAVLEIAGLDKITVNNIVIDGNTISSTAGDVVLSPFEDGTVNVSDSRVVNVSDPIDPKDATNKQYVDAVAQGLKILPQALAFSNSNLSATYSNGTAGVGATLTATSNGAFADVDGIAIALNDNVILNGQTNKAQNGSYILTTVGSAGTPWVLTRAPFIDQASEMEGSFEFVTSGTTYGNTGWVLTSLTEPVVVGTTELLWVQFSGAGTYTNGDGLNLDGTKFSAKVDDISISINAVSKAIEVKPLGITDGLIADNTISNAKLVNSIITIEDDAANTDVLALGETIKINGGTGITTAITANNTITISGDDATDTVKGIASFANTDFIVSSGNVTLNVDRIEDIVDGLVASGQSITITYDDTLNSLTFAADIATTSVIGVAKFNSANFAVDTGDVTIVAIDGGTF